MASTIHQTSGAIMPDAQTVTVCRINGRWEARWYHRDERRYFTRISYQDGATAARALIRDWELGRVRIVNA